MRHTRGDRGRHCILEADGLNEAIGRTYASGFTDAEIAQALSLRPATLEKWVRQGGKAISGPLREFWLAREQGVAAWVIRNAQRRLK